MNTYKSVAKQITLTIFRINIYEEGRRRGPYISGMPSSKQASARRLLRQMFRPQGKTDRAFFPWSSAPLLSGPAGETILPAVQQQRHTLTSSNPQRYISRPEEL